MEGARRGIQGFLCVALYDREFRGVKEMGILALTLIAQTLKCTSLAELPRGQYHPDGGSVRARIKWLGEARVLEHRYVDSRTCRWAGMHIYNILP